MSKLNIQPEMSIEELGQKVSSYLKDHWEEVLANTIEELQKLFPKYEDATYGMYLDKLLPPAWKELKKAGFQSAEKTKEDDFIIGGCLNFRNSIEKAKWGTPDHEKRIFWIVIENQNKQLIGTFLFELSHSHVNFNLPSPPKLMTFTSTERNEITKKILSLNENS
ncbi:hypothetical protein H9I32_11650 [Bacillus sp. Xin]|uniref:DUF6022 family protein n=1 Tax=unclassified Bacillus (in: firmicutes) TaxID=185979 RepID=UPI001573ABE9|nr:MULTISPECIES: DUF6022 family protein [unclassified Bacillus (in: firmicutes)]MBC6973008.1 hypothetical protein [Bacillus sp. Xin]NSW37655.1 hypothetical protein [Bacillus sp. Xin1]